MSNLTVVPVMSRSHQRQFLQLPWKLYARDPFWIPPLRTNQKELVGYKPHPFYERNEVQTFLALRDGEPCGRVAAIVNYAHMERYDDPRGFFGFFECVDDGEVAKGLFDAVQSWFAERNIVDFRGPINPSLNYEVGLLIDGFDSSPWFMMTYNPPYYAQLIEDYGFRKVQDLYAYWGRAEMLERLDKKLDFIFEEAQRRFGITMRRLDRTRYDEEVRMFLRIYNDALGGTWGFTPLSNGEIEHMAKALRHLIVPEVTERGRGRGSSGRRRVRHVGLQSPHQADRRATVSAGVHAVALEPAEDQAVAVDQHQCRSGVPALGAGSGTAGWLAGPGSRVRNR